MDYGKLNKKVNYLKEILSGHSSRHITSGKFPSLQLTSSFHLIFGFHENMTPDFCTLLRGAGNYCNIYLTAKSATGLRA